MACFPSFFVFLLCIMLGWNQVVGQLFYNVTVDDNDAAISYTGNWQQSTYTELDQGGRHMIAVDPEAFAVFTFRGAAIYFLSPLWPYNLTTEVQLDSGPPQIVSLRDVNAPETFGGPETAASRVVWGIDSLDDQLHQLRITVSPGDRFAIVDGFIVTAVNQKNEYLTTSTKTEATPISLQINATTSTATATATTTAAATDIPSSRESRTGKLTVPIGVGIGLGVLALLVASMVLYKFCHRRRTAASRGTPQLDLEKNSPPSTFRPASGCATPSEPTPPRFDIRISGDPSFSSPIRTALEGFSTSPPKYGTLLSPTLPPATHSVEPALRRITFNRPPPAYHECVDSVCREN